MVSDKMCNSVRDDIGLTGTGARHNEHRTVCMGCSLPLLLVEFL